MPFHGGYDGHETISGCYYIRQADGFNPVRNGFGAFFIVINYIFGESIMTTLSMLKQVQIFDSSLTENEKKAIKFKIYLNGKEGDVLASYWDFMEFLSLYNIPKSSITAALTEAGVEIETPEGIARF